jgi:AAA15 family ATPase/GTPase
LLRPKNGLFVGLAPAGWNTKTMKLEIRSLRAINCGPFQDVCIDFCDSSGKPQPITILAGANGSGKTTALELIVTLFEFLNVEDAHSDIPKMLEIVIKRNGYAQMDCMMNEKSVSIYSGTPPVDVELKPICFGVSKSRVEGYYETKGFALPEIGGLSHQNKQTIPFSLMGKVPDALPIPSVLYFPHNRSLLPLEGKQIQREETKYQWVYRYETVRSFAGSLDSYLVWLDYAEPETFAHVIEFLNSLDFDGKKFSVQRKELKAVVTTRDGQTHYLEDLSSGEQNILIMLLELRRRLLPHSIVLTDEIENSLHPAFQYRLAKALQRMQEDIPFQLIVTTHAQAFVDIFGTDTVRILTEF